MKYLQGSRIKLRKFEERSITPEYIDWLNDPEVNKFLDTGRLPIIKEEVFAPKDDKNLMFMVMANFYIEDSGQVEKDSGFNKYIGTCSLHKIDWISRKAEIGYMIGNKKYWGRGIASEVVKLLTEYGFDRLNLNKLVAGVVSGNGGSTSALIKNNFKQFALLEQEYYLDGKLENVCLFHNFQKWHQDKKSKEEK